MNYTRSTLPVAKRMELLKKLIKTTEKELENKGLDYTVPVLAVHKLENQLLRNEIKELKDEIESRKSGAFYREGGTDD
jgi:hypothetical protein